MELLKSAEVYDKYITPAGQGFLDGITSSGYEPEVVSKKEFDELLKLNQDMVKGNSNNLDDLETLKVKYNDLLRKYNKLISKKRLFK